MDHIEFRRLCLDAVARIDVRRHGAAAAGDREYLLEAVEKSERFEVGEDTVNDAVFIAREWLSDDDV